MIPYWSELESPDEGHAHHACLGRSVVRVADIAPEPAAGCHVDYSPVTLVGHHGGGVTGHVEGALQVDGDDRVEVLLGHLEEAGIAEVSGIVDEDVEASELTSRSLDDSFGRAEIGDGLVCRQGPSPAATDLVRHFRCRIPFAGSSVQRGAEIVYNDGRTFCRQAESDLLSDTSTAAGHDRNSSVQEHPIPPIRRLE